MNWVNIIMALLVLGVIGLIFGVILTLSAKKFFVPSDERVSQVRGCLPGVNCGACGFAGCDAFAEAVVEEAAAPNACSAGGARTATALGDVMGMEIEPLEPKVARVLCQGTSGVTKARYEYDGYRSCRIAASLSGGPKQCRFSCVGLGDCAHACRFDAIVMRDQVAYIDEERCVGCGVCAGVCPRHVIEIKPIDAHVLVRCRNSDAAREARVVCMKACIGCGRCVKQCKYQAIEVVNGFAVIDDDRCTRCGECVGVCPCKCITIQGKRR